jgi:hypothetical protein
MSIRLTLASTACLMISCAAVERPNILWITSEDNAAHWLGSNAAVCAVVCPTILTDLPEVRRDVTLYHDKMTQIDTQIGAILDDLEEAGLRMTRSYSFIPTTAISRRCCRTGIRASACWQPKHFTPQDKPSRPQWR